MLDISPDWEAYNENMKEHRLYDSYETKIELTSVIKNHQIIAQYWNEDIYKLQVIFKYKRAFKIYKLRINNKVAMYQWF